ncbi:MAG: hypothetical protein IPK22_19495 [Verrucomicrobiaceae bacterium]|nr:hypothetical protein [Verrucomicrobiaceae bacterium]
MEKNFSKKLKNTFCKRLTNFELYPERCPYIFSGDVVFVRRHHAGRLLIFVIATPDHHGGNRFTIDLGWSLQGRFPELPRRPFGSYSGNDSVFDASEFTFRISDVMNKNDFWWEEGRKTQLDEIMIDEAETILTHAAEAAIRAVDTCLVKIVKKTEGL